MLVQHSSPALPIHLHHKHNRKKVPCPIALCNDYAIDNVSLHPLNKTEPISLGSLSHLSSLPLQASHTLLLPLGSHGRKQITPRPVLVEDASERICYRWFGTQKEKSSSFYVYVVFNLGFLQLGFQSFT
eukprot:TRINITY_DN4823_c0_g1_i2.p1 TRINITY_DN4823_c0_g1~~TRINITY_DN4823_c0_g1_i2.p1  ORF type:complete len:129 (+),score=12.84 TRINITY_DN4823_c0_g1_i2:34-420(+)